MYSILLLSSVITVIFFDHGNSSYYILPWRAIQTISLLIHRFGQWVLASCRYPIHLRYQWLTEISFAIPFEVSALYPSDLLTVGT